jgi:hypothetical protein
VVDRLNAIAADQAKDLSGYLNAAIQRMSDKPTTREIAVYLCVTCDQYFEH